MEVTSIKKSQQGPQQVKKKRQTTTALLPPCRVCGDVSSGFHYGAVTCDACKGFFLRSLDKRNKPLKCLQDARCMILGRYKGMSKCPKCRWEKILSLGMSKDATQNGRYPANRRTALIKEVKAKSNLKFKTENDRHGVGKMRGKFVDVGASGDKRGDLGYIVSALTCENVVDYGLEHDLDDGHIRWIIGHISNVYSSSTCITEEFIRKMPEREAIYLEKKKREAQLFGEIKPISTAEYLAFKMATGIDVDGRKEILKFVTEKAFVIVRLVVKLVKAIPKFSFLCLTDQMAILRNFKKSGAFLILLHKQYSPELKLFHITEDVIYDDKTAMMFFDFNELAVVVMERLVKLQLKREEVAMTVLVCMLLADQVDLVEPKKVQDCLDVCVRCLLVLLRENHEGDSFIFPRLIGIFVTMRSLNLDLKKIEEIFNAEVNAEFYVFDDD